MSAQRAADEDLAADARSPKAALRWDGSRKLIILALTCIGIFEALTMSPELAWDAVPNWVSTPITLIGFGAFILLVGPFGNAAAAVGLMLVGRSYCEQMPRRSRIDRENVGRDRGVPVNGCAH